MVRILNEKCDSLELELENMKHSTQEEQKSDLLSKEDVIADLKGNWNYLSNSERMMFLQKFVKKIIITVKKYGATNCEAVVENILFN